jgi:D-alanyl-D-alanine carboxypeptidase/D-alanyl-D-alanine-endopeptidase (penicillin-binding protein 4)
MKSWLKSRIAVTLFAAAFATAAPAGAKPGEPVAAAAAKPVSKPATRSRTAVASKPGRTRAVAAAPITAQIAAPAPGKHDGAHARVAVAIDHAELRPAREVVGRRDEPLTAEEETAKQIEALLRGPLRYGTTGLFVADARTGEALFAVNAEDPLNPASNVKMISTATALDLLGADFRYPTRVLGATPAAGVVRGDVYLFGSYDPTLTLGDLDQIAAAIAARGVTRIDGGIVVGTDPARDGVFGAAVPIAVRAGATAGAPAIAAAPAGMDLVTIKMVARTARAGRPRLSYQVESSTADAGPPRVVVTITGTIGRGGATTYTLPLRERTAMAAYALRASLRAHGVAIAGEVKTAELDGFVHDASAAGNLPIELGRHDSPRLADIVAKVNKWSINWLADRVIMTAAALTQHQPPSMELALAAMYDWLGRHPHIAKGDLVVDTGSGLSYHTRITPHELVSIVRSAGGFDAGAPSDADLAHAWLDSLSIAGTDGTLSGRFRGDLRGRIHAKTGTLSTVVALSGVLDVDPDRPLVFSLVTNGDTPLSTRYIRHAHEQVIGVISRYLRKTQKTPGLAPPAAPVPAIAPLPGEIDRSELDDETEPSDGEPSP